MKCQICRKEMLHEVDRMDHIICEESYICPAGHYLNEYLYGYGRTVVKNHPFFTYDWHEISRQMSKWQHFKLKLSRFICRMYLNWLEQ